MPKLLVEGKCPDCGEKWEGILEYIPKDAESCIAYVDVKSDPITYLIGHHNGVPLGSGRCNRMYLSGNAIGYLLVGRRMTIRTSSVTLYLGGELRIDNQSYSLVEG